MRCPSCSAEQSRPGSLCDRCGAHLSPSGWTTAAGVPPPSPLPRREFPHGADFADRYTLIERVGEGGMGEVYKAMDRRLDSVVALKLIQPSLAAHPEAIRRFKSEVLLARQISHPNVCRVHDLGESGGTLYLTMAWIEGETLRRFMDQAGTLAPETALSIAEQVARGLEAAHARQVVHRDLKPENIMIDARGAISVMDFGLATVSGTPMPSGAVQVVGTPPYMSPEQRRGEEADPRSDLYAFGLVLWEMLTGRWPGTPPDEVEIRARVPMPLVPLLTSLLERDRASRCASATALLAGIEAARAGLKDAPPEPAPVPRPPLRIGALAAGGLAIAAGLLAVGLWPPAPRPRRESMPSQTAPPVETIAEPGEGFFERGLQYLRDDGDTTRGLGNALQMLHRAVDRDPSNARAWAILGEAAWTRFRRMKLPEDRTEAEGAVTRALVLHPDLPEGLHARGLGVFYSGDAAAARGDFEHAVALDPGLDAAWESLGNAHRDLGDYAEGRRCLETAVRLRPGSYIHRIAMGRFFEHFAEYQAAADTYEKAIEIKPEQPWGWNNLGAMYLHLEHRPDKALPAFKRSLELEDRGIAHTNLGTAYLYLGDFDQALPEYRRATDMEPDNADNWGNLGDALQWLNRRAEAHEAYGKAEALARDAATASPQDPTAQKQLALYCAKSGEPDCAREAAARANALEPDNVGIEFTNAVAHAAGLRTGEALDWLDRAVRHGLASGQIKAEPFFEPLRTLPRYRALLSRAA
jgi:serine/threonine protein kinase/Flp pilus assembly protein TadD